MVQPKVITDLGILWDEAPEGRKSEVRVTISMPKALYETTQEMLVHPALPYKSNMSAFARQAIAGLNDALQEFLSKDGKMLFHSLMAAQKRLTNERYALQVQDAIEEQIDNLRNWTLIKEWSAIMADLLFWARTIDEFPVYAWKARAALVWISNDGVKNLRRIWMTAEEMDESTKSKIQEIFEHWERLARV